MAGTPVGERIRAARKRAGLTQRALARRSGVAQPHISAIESGRVNPTEAVVDRLIEAAAVRPSVLLDQSRDRIREVVAAHGASNARVFGSVARGDDEPGSDIDLLISFVPGTTIFDLAALAGDLEDLLGVHVDIVGDSGGGDVLERARAEAVRV
jgi:uncharacterized protein